MPSMRLRMYLVTCAHALGLLAVSGRVSALNDSVQVAVSSVSSAAREGALPDDHALSLGR